MTASIEHWRRASASPTRNAHSALSPVHPTLRCCTHCCVHQRVLRRPEAAGRRAGRRAGQQPPPRLPAHLAAAARAPAPRGRQGRPAERLRRAEPLPRNQVHHGRKSENPARDARQVAGRSVVLQLEIGHGCNHCCCSWTATASSTAPLPTGFLLPLACLLIAGPSAVLSVCRSVCL